MILTVVTSGQEVRILEHGTCVCNRKPQSIINCLSSGLCSSNPLNEPRPTGVVPVDVGHAWVVYDGMMHIRHIETQMNQVDIVGRIVLPIILVVLGVVLGLAGSWLGAGMMVGVAGMSVIMYGRERRRMRRGPSDP